MIHGESLSVGSQSSSEGVNAACVFSFSFISTLQCSYIHLLSGNYWQNVLLINVVIKK